MGIFSKLFSHKNDDKKVGGMEDYMTLVRVYFQAALASQLGILIWQCCQTCECSRPVCMFQL